MVPMAPSTTRIRSVERSSLNGCICYCKKKSRAKQRGTSNPFEVGSGLSSDYPSCLAGYFAWPQVALTHHVFIAAYTPRGLRLSSLSVSTHACHLWDRSGGWC